MTQAWDFVDAAVFWETRAAVLCRRIEYLDLSVRARNCLRVAGIQTVGELIEETSKDLRRIHNFGKKSLWEVEYELARYGLKIKDRRT